MFSMDHLRVLPNAHPVFKGFLLAGCFLFLLGCGGGGETDAAGPNCAMQAKVNGANWCGTAEFSVSFGPPGGNPVLIIGNADGTAIVIEIASTNNGTYPLTRGEAVYSDKSFTSFASVSGTLVVTTSTPAQLVGTFSFEAIDPRTNGRVVVTSGQFTAPKR